MKNKKVILAILLTLAALWHRSDGQPQRPVREQLRLAGVMPKGALVYAQARDLGTLMKAWLASTVRDKFYKSKSYSAFTNSRIYLKMQDRLNDIEKAVGFGLSEERLAEIAGGMSAISIYDIGKLEIAFVTEMARDRVIATSLFKLAPQLEERSADDSTYYVRDVATDGGRLHQQFCFAHISGKLIVTTTEGLMIRAIHNIKSPGDDNVLADLLAMTGEARGFTAHEVTMWLDQARLNQNLYFNNYWIHHNSKSQLAGIESGLIDLRITPEGMTEQRWFKLAAGRQPSTAGEIGANEVAALLKFAPTDAQFVEISAEGANSEKLGASVSQTFFGKLPDIASGDFSGAGYNSNASDESDDEESGRSRSERYAQLDARFDMDVDDENAMREGGRGQSNKRKSTSEDDKRFARAVTAVLSKVQPVSNAEMVRSKADQASPFVRFERAVVIEMKQGASVDRAALERAILDEMRARFVISGLDPKLAWQEEAGVRYLAQSLLEQGAAYCLSGKYLVLASSREFARDILAASTSQAAGTAQRIDGAVATYALVRVSAAKPIFDKLMMKLDGKIEKAAGTDNEDEESNEESGTVNFFSENISSLISASSIREIRLRRENAGSMMTERVVYLW